MSLNTFSARNFRNLMDVDLIFTQAGLNLFYGENGSGKTSLLEAIYYLGLGRSFRSAQANNLIQHNATQFSIFSELLNSSAQIVPVGMQRDMQGISRMKINGAEMSRTSELASLIPILLVNTQSHLLLEGGPLYRRKFVDWGLFYQLSDSFMRVWRAYERSLRQRNALLKAKKPKQDVESWTNELVKHGLALTNMREQYLAEFSASLKQLLAPLLPFESLTISYDSGWKSSIEFNEALSAQFLEDFRMGHTTIGPHRADFDIILDGCSAKHFLSRGQQKLLVCAMILAQGRLLTQQTNRPPVYLIDDFPSELDDASQLKLMHQLSCQPSQIFMTAIDHEVIVKAFQSSVESKEIRMFHVKHGHVTSQTRDKLLE